MSTLARQTLDHGPTTGLFPQALESERRPDAPSRSNRRFAAVERVEHDRLVGKARSRAQQPLQLPALPQLVDPPERGDHLLAHRRAFASALDDLQIGAAARGLPAEIHGSWLVARLERGAHTITPQHQKINKKYPNDVALQHRNKTPPYPMISMSYDRPHPSNCRRSVIIRES